MPENWHWIYKLENNPISSQIKPGNLQTRSQHILNQQARCYGLELINHTNLFQDESLPPFVLGRRNWKAQCKPTFQTPVALCLSVQQGCSSDIWNPPERKLLWALLFNKIILFGICVDPLSDCGPHNCHRLQPAGSFAALQQRPGKTQLQYVLVRLSQLFLEYFTCISAGVAM